MQLDQEHKGFSFLREGPLDMRMNPFGGLSAEQIINDWSERELGEVFWEYGEEPRWKSIAKAIVEARKKSYIRTTKQLAEIVAGCRAKVKGRLHPATLVFQALRICVNQELDSLKKGLRIAMQLLGPGGRMGVISFHSLEDRIVKHLFREEATPIREGKEKLLPLLKLLTKKPVIPSFVEVKSNPRARSAKMRFVEKNER